MIGRDVCGGSDIVSGKHCEIYLHEFGYFIRDNKSSNKTFFLIGKQEGLYFLNGTQHMISFNTCFYIVKAIYKKKNFYITFEPLRKEMQTSQIKLNTSEHTFITNNRNNFEVSIVDENDKTIFADAKIEENKIKLTPYFDEVLLLIYLF